MNKGYSLFTTVVLRTPYFSLKKFKQLISNEKTLKSFCLQKDFKEALYLASPEFYSEVVKWINDSIKNKKEKDKIEQTLYRYLARISTRSTPFGLFAGITTAKLSDASEQFNTQCNNTEMKFRVTRLDMNYVCALSQYLSLQVGIREQLKFYTNNSIYQLANKIRYVEYSYSKKNKRLHQITSIDKSLYVDKVIKEANNGRKIAHLVNSIVDDEITYDIAYEFIEELINAQILISELEPSITESDYLGSLIKKIENLEKCDFIVKELNEVRNILNKIDKKPPGVDINNYYDRIKTRLSYIGVNYNEKYLFQTDMLIHNKPNSFNVSIAYDVLDAVELLNKLSAPSKESNITKFAAEFLKRYESREISLTTLLDPETGLGYPVNQTNNSDLSPLICDLLLPNSKLEDYQIKWNKEQSFLLNKYHEALKNDYYNVELNFDDLKGFDRDYNDLPLTISAVIQLLPSENQDERNRILLDSIGGNSALCLIGRFCHTSHKLYDHAKLIAQKEMELVGDAIVAEIIHLPEARTGNILMHPKFYDYEIPYLAQASVDNIHTIEVSDLMVSVKHNRIRLRSKKMNKEIIPRLSNAHNFTFNSLPIYRFLCDLQLQDRRGSINFSWGVLSNDYSFLPRVTYKNIILSLASWNISNEEILPLLNSNNNEELMCNVKHLCKIRKIPQLVTLVEGDNKLVIDMNCLLSVKTLIELVKKSKIFKLQEYLNHYKNNPVKDVKGESFANEIILSFYKNNN